MPKVRLHDIATLRPHPENPRQGDVGAISTSIAKNGWWGTVVVWADPEGDGATILAGEHRCRALTDLQAHGAVLDDETFTYTQLRGRVELPPAGKIHVWEYAHDQLTEALARRILIADNAAPDIATNDDAALAAVLAAILEEEGSLLGAVYDEDDLDALYLALDRADSDLGALMQGGDRNAAARNVQQQDAINREMETVMVTVACSEPDRDTILTAVALRRARSEGMTQGQALAAIAADWNASQ